MYGGAGDASYTANTLAWVDSAALTVTAVKLSNKDKLTVELYLNAYYIAHVRYLQERDEVVLDNGGGGEDKDDDEDDESDDDIDASAATTAVVVQAHNKINKSSLNDVLGRLPLFLSAKSVLVEMAEEAGHILLLSSKYHAEAAGQGVEYCFGRATWWFKKHNRESTEALKELLASAFLHDVVSVDHVQKFAPKNRNYHRVYRSGVVGLKAEEAVKKCKSHRCALDTD